MLLNSLETYYDLLRNHGPVKLVRTWEEKARIRGNRSRSHSREWFSRESLKGSAMKALCSSTIMEGFIK